eukprot:3828472-Pyramimonas_sp.AAC.1
MKKDKKAPNKPFVDPEAAAVFEEIFGSGRNPPPNKVTAARVLVDCANKFPDGKEHAGKSRGCLDLTQYRVTKGAQQYTDRRSNDRMYDQEIFITQM